MIKSETLYYRMIRPVLNGASRIMFNLDIHRHAPIPEGAKILAPNHPTTTDPFLLLGLTREHVHILIERKIFQVPFWGNLVLKGGQIPVDRENGRRAFNQGLERLRNGETVGIYPEGHISPMSGGFCRPKTGVVRMALMTGAPIIPIGIYVDRSRIQVVDITIEENDMPATWYFRGPYAMTIGEPIHLEGDVEDREYVRASTRYLMKRITQLSHESAYRSTTPHEANLFIKGKLVNALGSAAE